METHMKIISFFFALVLSVQAQASARGYVCFEGVHAITGIPAERWVMTIVYDPSKGVYSAKLLDASRVLQGEEIIRRHVNDNTLGKQGFMIAFEPNTKASTFSDFESGLK